MTASFRSAGTADRGTGTNAPPNPANIIAGDLLLCVVETENQNTAGAPTTSTGTWAEVTNSPQGSGPSGAAGGTGLRVYWKWSVGASEGATTVPDSGVYTASRIYAYKDVGTGSGNPFDGTPNGGFDTGGTAGTAPGVTTTADAELVVVAVSNAADIATDQYSGGFTNANLSGIANRGGGQWITQNGGGYTVMDGTKATAGATGNTTWTQGSSARKCYLTMALVSVPPATNASAGLAAGTGTAYSPARTLVAQAVAALAAGTGTAYGPGAQAGYSAAAGLASGTGSAPAPVADVPAARLITSLAGGDLGYFADQNGDPILYAQCVGWGLLANAGRWSGSGGGTWQQDMVTYMSARAAQGYNCMRVHLLGTTETGGINDNGDTWDGVHPFTTGTNPSSGLNETYWARFDYMLDQAEALGMTIEATATFTYDFGTGVLCNAWTTQQCTDWGTALGDRYKDRAALLWFFGDDYFSTLDTQFSAVLTGLRNAGDTHLVTIENYNSGTTSLRDLSGSPTSGTVLAWGAAHADYSCCYYYFPVFFSVEFAYQESGAAGPIPVIWGDGFYVGGVGGGDDADGARIMRNMSWWAMASGARGISNGSNATMFWDAASDIAATTSEEWFADWSANVIAAFTALDGWHLLIPDTGNALVTAGRGTRTAYSDQFWSSTDSSNYVAASRTPDGSLAVIYCATSFSITIDETKMAAGYTAKRIDPASGSATTVTPGSTYASAGWGTNADGGSDWVLVLQGPPGQFAVGSAAATGTAPAPQAVTETPGSYPVAPALAAAQAGPVSAYLASTGGGGSAAFDAVGPAGGAGTSGGNSITWAHVNSAAGNALLVGVTDLSGTAADVTSVTYGTGGSQVSLTRLGYIPSNNIGQGGIELWAKLGGLPTGSNTVTVTTNAENHNCGSVSLSNVASLGAAVTSYGNGSTYTSGSITSTSGGMLVAAFCEGGGGTWAPSGGSTLRWSHNNGTSTGADNGGMFTKASPGGAATVAATAASDYWGCVAVEALPAGGAGVVVAPAGRAEATGTAPAVSLGAGAGASGTAGLAAGTGAGYGPALTLAAQPAVGAALPAGTAYSPGRTLAAQPGVGAALGTGAGYGPARTLAAQPAVGAALPAGTAYGPGTTLAAQPPVGAAAGTGTAPNPAAQTGAQASPAAGLAAGTGTSYAPGLAASAALGAAAGTGAAWTPVAQVAKSGTAGLAAGAGTAYGPGITLAAQPPVTLAAGTGAAPQVTSSTSAAANAVAGLGSAAGAAPAPAALPAKLGTAVAAAGTGTAYSPGRTLAAQPGAGAAAGTGTAPGAGTQIAQPAPVTLAAGAGTAYGPVILAAALIGAGLANGTAAAPGITASTQSQGQGQAGLAAGTGTAPQPAALPAKLGTAGAGTGTGTAYRPAGVPGMSYAAGAANGTGAAWGPSLTLAGRGLAGLGSVSGAALAPAGQAAKFYPAVLAAGTGTGYSAGLSLAGRGVAGLAAALGAATSPAWRGLVAVVYGTAVTAGGPLVASTAGEGDVAHSFTSGAAPGAALTSGRP